MVVEVSDQVGLAERPADRLEAGHAIAAVCHYHDLYCGWMPLGPLDGRREAPCRNVSNVIKNVTQCHGSRGAKRSGMERQQVKRRRGTEHQSTKIMTRGHVDDRFRHFTAISEGLFQEVMPHTSGSILRLLNHFAYDLREVSEGNPLTRNKIDVCAACTSAACGELNRPVPVDQMHENRLLAQQR